MTREERDRFILRFHDSMRAVRQIWPWTRFIVMTNGLTIVGMGGPVRPARYANDNAFTIRGPS